MRYFREPLEEEQERLLEAVVERIASLPPCDHEWAEMPSGKEHCTKCGAARNGWRE